MLSFVCWFGVGCWHTSGTLLYHLVHLTYITSNKCISLDAEEFVAWYPRSSTHKRLSFLVASRSGHVSRSLPVVPLTTASCQPCFVADALVARPLLCFQPTRCNRWKLDCSSSWFRSFEKAFSASEIVSRCHPKIASCGSCRTCSATCRCEREKQQQQYLISNAAVH